ncbi:MAG: DUF1566 domain-containing protein [Deltaproteobacteria bacterium]|nr:DUF1566 domain-containing protein [Deltaproteobacteria bacterium]
MKAKLIFILLTYALFALLTGCEKREALPPASKKPKLLVVPLAGGSNLAPGFHDSLNRSIQYALANLQRFDIVKPRETKCAEEDLGCVLRETHVDHVVGWKLYKSGICYHLMMEHYTGNQDTPDSLDRNIVIDDYIVDPRRCIERSPDYDPLNFVKENVLETMGNDRLAKLRGSLSSSLLLLPVDTGSGFDLPARQVSDGVASALAAMGFSNVRMLTEAESSAGVKAASSLCASLEQYRAAEGLEVRLDQCGKVYMATLSHCLRRSSGACEIEETKKCMSLGPIEGPEGCCLTGVNEQSLANLITDNAVGLITGGGEFARYIAKKDHTFQRQAQVPEVTPSDLVAGRFHVDGDLVYDYRLGLIWCKRSKTDARYTRNDAMGYAEKVFSVQGYKNWRLPSPLEMQSLYYDAPDRQKRTNYSKTSERPRPTLLNPIFEYPPGAYWMAGARVSASVILEEVLAGEKNSWLVSNTREHARLFPVKPFPKEARTRYAALMGQVAPIPLRFTVSFIGGTKEIDSAAEFLTLTTGKQVAAFGLENWLEEHNRTGVSFHLHGTEAGMGDLLNYLVSNNALGVIHDNSLYLITSAANATPRNKGATVAAYRRQQGQ